MRYTAPGVEASFAYDAAGQRVRAVVAQGSLTTTSTYAYDGLALLSYAAMRSDGATWSVDYLTDERGVVFAGVYASSDASAAVPFLAVTTDRGDVRELVDTQGSAFAHYAYDAYGSPTETTSTATSLLPAPVASAIAERNPLRYAGYAFDGFSGLYYCSQRYYDPETVSFVSKDPAKADGEESAYQYCGGDPVGRVDPSGEAATTSCHRSSSLSGPWKTDYYRSQYIEEYRGVGGWMLGTNYRSRVKMTWALVGGRISVSARAETTPRSNLASGDTGGPLSLETEIRRSSGGTYKKRWRYSGSRGSTVYFASGSYGEHWITRARVLYVWCTRQGGYSQPGSAVGQWHSNTWGKKRPRAKVARCH